MRTRVTLYIPDTDRYGEKIDHAHWTAAACRFFSRIAGGATVIPNAYGVWLEGEMLIRENVTIVYSSIPETSDLTAIKRFAALFAESTQQAAVALEIGEQFVLIPSIEGGEHATT